MRDYFCLIFCVIFLLCSLSCDQTTEQVIPDNDAFSTTGISKIKIENYVNRLFIDIIGREPTDVEFKLHSDTLNANDLSKEIRLDLINMLMTDTSYRENEGSYQEAYSLNLFLLAKIRCLEGTPDEEIYLRLGNARNAAFADSLNMNWDSYYQNLEQIRRYELMLNAGQALVDGDILYHQVYAFMIDNGVYDELNMNSFNFIRATFDQLLYRLPTEQEYLRAYDMVENRQLVELFERNGSNKNDYINILVHSEAMLEGMILWAYQVYLQRPPEPAEISTLLLEYQNHKNINLLLSKIFVTDEYANFY